MSSGGAAQQPVHQGHPNLSSKLKSMRFMQRASEKRNLQKAQVTQLAVQGEEAADVSERPTETSHPAGQEQGGEDSLPSTSDAQPPKKKGCRVVYGAAPLPGALAGGRFSFGGFNPQTEKLYAEMTGTPMPSANDKEKEVAAAQDSRRGTDVPAADMAHAFQRGGAVKGEKSGQKRQQLQQQQQGSKKRKG